MESENKSPSRKSKKSEQIKTERQDSQLKISKSEAPKVDIDTSAIAKPSKVNK
jgi:hypothetical protein